MPDSILQIKSLPGIKRDGTRFEGDAYVDGQWVRFQRGLPRKIGGYRSASRYLTEISRSLSAYTQNGFTYIHSGSATKVERLYIDNDGNASVVTDRTPLSLTADDNNMWQFDVETDPTGNLIMAHVAPNLLNITNNEGGQLFYGSLLGTDPLTEVTLLPTGYSVTGGVVALHPYTFIYGNDGYVAWSVVGDPTDFTGSGSGSANVASQKIVKGLPLRGGPGNSPSGLFWTADAVVRTSFVGGDAVFQFDTISTQSSILSADSVIEYDGIFFWAGIDRFLMFNGVVREVPNGLNLNWFFDGLNMQYRQKVFATKVPRYGEIWWCYPRGDNTECSHAVIYNVREDTWYDCELPNSGRSAGTPASVFPKPMMTGVESSVSQHEGRVSEDGDSRISETGDARVTEFSEILLYKLWVHEDGVDEIDGLNLQPIQSYFETADISLPVIAQDNHALNVIHMEPDFVQSGDMTVQLKGRANAKSPEVDGELLTIYETPPQPTNQIIHFKGQRRQLRFRFESNVIGGDYQMGLILALLKPGDGTVIG